MFLPVSPDGQPLRRCHVTATSVARLAPFRSRRQRGEGKLKTILFLLFFASMIFIGFRTVPAYVAEYQLADKMQEQARFSIVNRYNEEQVRDNIYKVVKDLEIPVKREEIKVVSNNDVVKISMDYTIPVDLLVYQLNLHFTPTSENKAL